MEVDADHIKRVTYRVDGFAEITQKLAELGVQKERESSSTHYYTVQPNNDVVKLVRHSDDCEVHMLKEESGKFTLTDRIRLKNVSEGVKWLRDNGYDRVAVVTMKHTDYLYKDGIVGLYVINGVLYSMILDFVPGEHTAIAEELGIEGADLIKLPYNKYLEQRGELEAVSLAQL